MSDTTPKAGEYWIVEWVNSEVWGVERDIVKAVSRFDGVLRFLTIGDEAVLRAESFRFIRRVNVED